MSTDKTEWVDHQRLAVKTEWVDHRGIAVERLVGPLAAAFGVDWRVVQEVTATYDSVTVKWVELDPLVVHVVTREWEDIGYALRDTLVGAS